MVAQGSPGREKSLPQAQPNPGTRLPRTSELIQERWVEVDGHRVRYLTGGLGPPLLLVHGLLGYSFSWRFNFDALSSHATVYAPDMLGLGYSERVAGLECDLNAHARRMWAFLDAVGAGDAHVLGSSHGGAVALRMAAEAPRRVRSLLLVSPVNPWSRRARLLIRVLRRFPAGVYRFAGIYERIRAFMLVRLYADRRRVAPGTIAGYSAPMGIPGTYEHVLKILKCWHRDLERMKRWLPQIASIPALVLWGNRDTAVDPPSALRLSANFRESRLVMLDDCGHLPYEEFPEQFNRAVLAWLGEREGIRPGTEESAPTYPLSASIAGMRTVARRIGVFLLGSALLAVGLLLSLPGVPGPGLLIALAGLLVLASEFAWAHRLVTKLQQRFPRVAGYLDDARQRAKGWLRRISGRANAEAQDPS